jgi:hypothetical protein
VWTTERGLRPQPNDRQKNRMAKILLSVATIANCPRTHFFAPVFFACILLNPDSRGTTKGPAADRN